MTEPVFFWATVESLNPFTVRRDGETAPMGVSPSSLIDATLLPVGARIWCQLQHRRALVLGAAGGAPTVGPWHSVLSLRNTWEQYPGFLSMGVRRVSAGAQLVGFLRPSSSGPGTLSSGLILFEVPAAFRPLNSLRVSALISRSNDPAHFSLNRDGEFIKTEGDLSPRSSWININVIYPLD